MLPAVLLSVSIVVLVLRTEPQIITFVMLAMMPCAMLWWIVGWQGAAVYVVGYFVFRATRRVVGNRGIFRYNDHHGHFS